MKRARARGGKNHLVNGIESSTRSNLPRPLVERAGLPATLHFHDLRHSAATRLLIQGVHPKVVQERLGHSSITVTLDTYSHLIPSLGVKPRICSTERRPRTEGPKSICCSHLL